MIVRPFEPSRVQPEIPFVAEKTSPIESPEAPAVVGSESSENAQARRTKALNSKTKTKKEFPADTEKSIVRRSEPGGLAEETAPETDEKDPADSGAIDLFPKNVIERIARPPPEKSGPELAAARLRQWTEDWNDDARYRRAQAGDMTQALQELRGRFESWFTPATEIIARNSPDGLGNTHRIKTHGGVPAIVARISVVIEVDHDSQGVPERWRVANSSGDTEFDAAALSAVQTSLDWAREASLKPTRVAQNTQWSFEARAYRYWRYELLMRPGLLPKGSDLPEYDDGFGKTRIIRKASLVAVKYWPSSD